MNVIIAHKGIKREISGAFSLCLDKDTLKQLKDQLDKVEDHFVFGWVDINEPIDKGPSGPPVHWIEPFNGCEIE